MVFSRVMSHCLVFEFAYVVLTSKQTNSNWSSCSKVRTGMKTQAIAPHFVLSSPHPTLESSVGWRVCPFLVPSEALFSDPRVSQLALQPSVKYVFKT